MKVDPKKTYLAYAITAVLMFGVVGQLQGPIRWTREAEGTAQEDVFAKDIPNQAFLLILGGLRAIAINYFWVRSMTAQEEGRYHEVMFNMNLIAQLQPHFSDAYIFNGWNAAYNISHEAEDLEEKYGWVMIGYNYLRKGVRKNPHLYDIKFWTAWVLFDKISQNMTPEHRAYFTKRYMEDHNGRHPLRDAGIWFERAHKTPGAQLLAHRTMMTHVYVRLSEYYYLKGQREKEEEVVLRAYQNVMEIMKEEAGRASVTELVRSWNLYNRLRAEKRAALEIMKVKAADAVERLKKVLEEWDVEFKGNPFGLIVNLERAKVSEVLAQDSLERLNSPKLAADYCVRAYINYRRTAQRFVEFEELIEKQREYEKKVQKYSEEGHCSAPEQVWSAAQDI